MKIVNYGTWPANINQCHKTPAFKIEFGLFLVLPGEEGNLTLIIQIN